MTARGLVISVYVCAAHYVVAEALAIAGRTPARLELINTPPPMTNTAFDDGVEVRTESYWTRHLGFRRARPAHAIPAADCSQQVCRLHGSGSDSADRGCDDDTRK
jgi:hypothetical protein